MKLAITAIGCGLLISTTLYEKMRKMHNKAISLGRSASLRAGELRRYMPYEATGVLSSIGGIKEMLDRA